MNINDLVRATLDDGTCTEEHIKCKSDPLNYCGKPVPRGWVCTRPRKHDGKCVACMNHYKGDMEYYKSYRHNLT